MDRFTSVKFVLGCFLVSFFIFTVTQVEAAAPQLHPLGKLRSCNSLTTGVGVDNAGNLFLSKSRLKTISKFDTYGRKLHNFSPLEIGEGGLAVPPLGNVVYASANKDVLIINADTGDQIGQLGATEGQFEWVSAIDLDARGYVYVADSGARKVRIYTPQGAFHAEFGGPGDAPGQIGLLSALAINQATGEVWVADNLAKGKNAGPKILIFDQDGQFLREMSGATDFGSEPIGSFGALTFDPQGRIYIIDALKNEIRSIDPRTMGVATYTKAGFLSNKLVGASGLVFEPVTNRLFVSSGSEVTILGVDGAQRPVPLVTR